MNVLLCWVRDKGKVSLLIFFNLSAAFYTIDHGILLEQLPEFGVGDTALWWFQSFLAYHFQRVMLEDSSLAPWSIKCGIPQGLHLHETAE